MVDFAKLRKASSTDRLVKALESQSTKFKRDERYWQPEVDKAGNGFSVIRFLSAPAVDGDDAIAFVPYWSHSFKGPTGKWYIENSLTTLEQPDPVSEYNSELWATGKKENKDLASAQKRKLNFVSNILVIKDPAHPENEGKHFLFNYGVKIMDKIKDKLGMEVKAEEGSYVDPDDVKFDPFDFWKGADFKLKIRKVGDFRNYDKSEFAAPAPLFGDDAKIEKLWRELYSLKAEVAADKFKSYDDLKNKLNVVLGKAEDKKSTRSSAPARVQASAVSEDSVPEKSEAAEVAAATAPTSALAEGGDEEDFAAFARLADSN